MPATSLETARNFDPIQSRLVRKALKSREIEKARTRKSLLEAKRAETLMPSLREALVELINVSIRSVHKQEGGGIYSPRADHHFGYSIPISEEEPIEVELRIRADDRPSGPSVQIIDYFLFGASNQGEALTTSNGNPVLRQMNRVTSSGEGLTRPAKANHIEEHRDLARLLTLGVAKGLVSVRRK